MACGLTFDETIRQADSRKAAIMDIYGQNAGVVTIKNKAQLIIITDFKVKCHNWKR